MPAPSKRPSRAVVEQAIRDAGGVLSRAAGLLGCSSPTFYKWVRQLGLQRLAGIDIGNGSVVSSGVYVAGVSSKHTNINGKLPRHSAPRLEGMATNVNLPEPPEPKRQRGVVIPDSVWQAAQIEAVKRQISASEVVTIALRRLLAEQEQGQ